MSETIINIKSYYHISPYCIELTAEGFSEQDIPKLQAAINHISLFLGSPQLEDFIISFNYEMLICSGFLWWKKYHPTRFYEFHLNNGKSQKEIHAQITESKHIKLFLKLDPNDRKDLAGYTRPNTRWQWICKDFFYLMDYKMIAGNLVHEWLHKLGYDHGSFSDPLTKYSVPYAIGNFFRHV
jgi:hypothetical protein